MRTLFEQPRSGLASPWILLLPLAVVHTLTAGSAQESSADDSNPSRNNSVYAKIILPTEDAAAGEHPAVESWISESLRKQGEPELTSVTDWFQLAEKGKELRHIRIATARGEGLGTVWGEELAAKMLNAAGFHNVRIERLDHDILNNYYIMVK